MKGGVVIRLIDVVLILLFGFISISELSYKSQVELPKSTQIPLSNPDKEQIVIISISRNGTYGVEDDEYIFTRPDQLKSYILGKKERFAREKSAIRVRIRSDRNAPAKYTFALASICDYLNVSKSIDVQRIDR